MSPTLDLACKLVSIPSWVGNGCNEQKIGEFIFNWLQTNTQLDVIKQDVGGGRFNVIASGKGTVTTLLAGHMDTVAAGMVALSEAKNTTGIMFLAYVDEEYDFAGMRAFVTEYKNKIKPTLVISLDGYKEVIGNGCRGLIEVSFKLRGKSGHAGRPEMGVNAIVAGNNCITKLQRMLVAKYSDPILGITSPNLAYSQGGLDTGNGVYGRQGNNIPDLAEFVLDIRPATSNLTAEVVEKILAQYVKASKLQIEDWSVRHNLGAWSTSSQTIAEKVTLPGVYETFGGYVDTQMIWAAFDKPICLAIGASTRSVAHTPNEYVELVDLENTKNNCLSLIGL
jgi:succinyl-diaminopimelate desuccinylase